MNKIRQYIEKIIPIWAILPLVTIVLVNAFVYWGSAALTRGRFHYDFTMAFDRMVPLWPSFVWIYLLAFPFWIAGYILAARRGRDEFFRFVAVDLTVHFSCFVFFILIPTTNVRPEIAGSNLNEKMLLWLYRMDGGDHPSNLFPSIHCYVSWLCFRGIWKSREIPSWYQYFSLIFAALIIVSTQVLKQHYIVDAIAGVALVELAWYFYHKGNHHLGLKKLFERLSSAIFREGN